MATTSSKVLGTVTSVVGEVKATASDGSTRVLQVGDKVFSDEVISTSPTGDVKIALEGAGGRTLECGNDSNVALNEGLLGIGTAIATQDSSPVVPPSVAAQQEMAGPGGKPPAGPADVAALQAAIAAGADPSQVADATAAGGAPGAGGADGGGAHSPVVIEQGNTSQVVNSGFSTEGGAIQFPTPEFELNPVEETEAPPPVVSVSVQVQVDVENPNDPTGGVVVSGNAVSLIEGTNGEQGKLVNFVITLDKAFDADVQVTYTIMPGTAETPSDFFDGPLTQTVTIAAGETEIIVPVIIVQDHFVEADETFNIVLTDAVNATINPAANTAVVTIVDDDTAPVANADSNWAQEDLVLVATGNVLQNQPHSGDPSVSLNFADAADTDADGDSLTVTTTGAFSGTYGTLVLNSDGSYTYTLDNTLQAVQDLAPGDTLTENFSYTASDGFNAPSSSTLQITIFGSDDAPHITGLTPKGEGGDLTVNEDDLLESRGANESAGSDTSKESTTQTGTFNISTPDGLDDLTIGGHVVIADGVFTATSFTTALGNTLSVTAFDAGTGQVTYTYTLADNETHAEASGENSLFEDFTVVLTDVDGDSTSDTLSVNIVDDVPDALNEANGTATENNLTLTGNVLTNDVQGADGAAVTAATLSGTYGSVTIGADGAYTYTLNASDPQFVALGGGGTGNEVFTYTLTDADGDTDTATLTLAIQNDDDGVTITNLTPQASGGDVTVDEDDLLSSRGAGESAGSDTTKESTTQSGTFNISAPDGVDDLTIGSHAVITDGVFAATSFTTGLGNTLSITGYNAGTGEITYTYTLLDNETHTTANGENSLFEDFAVVLTDIDGDTANNILSVKIVDDVPSTGPAQTGMLENDPGVSLTAALPVTEGADGGLVTLSATHNGLYWTESDGTTVLTSGGVNLLYVQNSDGSLSAVVEGTSNVVFTVTANQASDTYTVTLSPTFLLDGATQTFNVDFTQALGGGNTPNVFFGSVGAGIVVWATATDPATAGTDTVNFSNTGAGVNQGDMISGTESLVFKMLDPENWTIPTGSNPPAPTYDGSGDKYVEFSTVTLTIDSLNGPVGNKAAEQLQVTAWHTEANGTLTQVDINQQVWIGTGNGSSDDDVFTIFSTDGNTFDTLIFTAANGTSDYRVASMTGTNTIDGTDHTIALTATITDTDGDTSTTSWDVTFAGADILQGASGSDVMVAGAGNEVLVGGGGNDILTGGAGSDTFKYSSLSDGQDTITDFTVAPTASGGDILNLQDVLAGVGSVIDNAVSAKDAGAVDNYVYFTVSGTTATLHVDVAGAGGGTPLASFSVTSGTSAGDLLQQLLNNNQIVT
jgi:large repetitive protein